MDDELQSGKYLTFKLGDEEYGLWVRPVEDILQLKPITSVPNTPDYLEGVINMRGSVIPVIDLRVRFGMKSREYDDKTCIVVVEHEDVRSGLIVDRVNEVLTLDEEKIEPTPPLGRSVEEEYLAGIARLEERILALVELGAMLSENRAVLEGAGQPSTP
jgi:purine-binding chemotaxis protein CheW